MSLDTFTNLKTSIADWLNRSDLTSVIPDFITMAEAKFNRDPRVQHEVRITITVSAATYALPSDTKSVTSLYFDDGTRQGAIEIVPPEQFAIIEGSRGTLTGAPRFAAISEDSATLLLSPVPDQSYTVQMIYEAKLTALSSGSPSNWLLSKHPDIYLFGTLLESAPYLKDDQRLPVWATELENRLTALGQLATHRRFSANSPVIRPRRAIG